MQKVFRGKGCISNYQSELVLGKKALIVTGKNSASVSGALDNIKKALDNQGIRYEIFDCLSENPLIETCEDGGYFASENGCDFIIAAGGGSVIDGAKAISVFAVDNSLGEDIYSLADDFPALPIVAVPLTCGTGSEANPISVLTVNGKKKSVSKKSLVPICTFLDPEYLLTISGKYLTSTVIDAFCHCIESYLSPKSTPQSERFALDGAKIIWKTIVSVPLSSGGSELSLETRMNLLDAAYFGGKAIAATGTGFPHPLGYQLTMRYGIPHGVACGCFTGEYIRLNLGTEEGNKRLKLFSSYIGTTPEMIGAVIPALSDVSLYADEKTVLEMTESASGAKNYKNSPFILDDKTSKDLYCTLLG